MGAKLFLGEVGPPADQQEVLAEAARESRLCSPGQRSAAPLARATGSAPPRGALAGADQGALASPALPAGGGDRATRDPLGGLAVRLRMRHRSEAVRRRDTRPVRTTKVTIP